MKKKENKKDAIDILFPDAEIDLGNGKVVKVTPLTLKDMPKVINSFGRLVGEASRGLSPADLAIRGLSELLQVVPYCIDCSPEDIPSPALPKILEIVIDQNLSEASLGKWSALMGHLSERVADQIGTDPSQSEN